MVLVIRKLKFRLIIVKLVKQMIIMEHMIIKLLELIRHRIIMGNMIIMEHMIIIMVRMIIIQQILIRHLQKLIIMGTFYFYYGTKKSILIFKRIF